MKFVPFELFRLNPVDIEKNINTHFEETLKELTRQNSDYHREIIQLGNQIIQLSGELEETKQELAKTVKPNPYQTQLSILAERYEKLERQNETLVKKLEAYRAAYRVIIRRLSRLGAKDPYTEVTDG